MVACCPSRENLVIVCVPLADGTDERDVSPSQVAMDYPVMLLQDIECEVGAMLESMPCRIATFFMDCTEISSRRVDDLDEARRISTVRIATI